MDWFKSNRKIQALRSIIENKVFGWKTDRKILVIESDDWGAIRTSNFVAYARFKNLGYDMESSCYNLDSLETNSDLIELYDVLDKFVDHRGRPCCFTANVVTTNPDFEFIEENQFEQYSYESVVDTAYNTEHSDDVVKLWKDGLNSKFFIPQLHCREHIRYWEWLNDLKLGKVEAIETFRYKMCGRRLVA